MKRKERLQIEPALAKLVSLLEKWGLEPGDYVLVDEFAYVLQGYRVHGPEVEGGHLDLYVNPSSLPWKAKQERSVVPPKDSEYMDEWTTFMEETGYGLDLLKGVPGIFETPFVDYRLPSGKKIRLMRAYEMTQAFVKQTIMYYSLEDVGEEKIREWIEKLELIEKAAREKRDESLANYCSEKLVESKNKWKTLFPF